MIAACYVTVDQRVDFLILPTLIMLTALKC